MDEQDVANLKQAGWTEAEILISPSSPVTEIFVTRIADALRVQLTEDYANLRKDYLESLMIGKKLLLEGGEALTPGKERGPQVFYCMSEVCYFRCRGAGLVFVGLTARKVPLMCP